MSNLIKAVAFIRSIDWTIIRVDVFDKGKQKLYEDDIELVIQKIQSNKPRQDERNKLQTGQGVWCYKQDDQQIFYLALTTNEYPERQSFAMIKEMERELKKFSEYSTTNPKDVSNFIKNFIKDLQDKYNNLMKIDKLSKAQNQVEEVRLIVEKNVQEMIKNTEQIDKLDERSDKMCQDAKQFQVQSSDLARIMYWRNMKLKIAIFVIVLAVVLYISVPLIIAASNNKQTHSTVTYLKQI